MEASSTSGGVHSTPASLTRSRTFIGTDSPSTLSSSVITLSGRGVGQGSDLSPSSGRQGGGPFGAPGDNRQPGAGEGRSYASPRESRPPRAGRRHSPGASPAPERARGNRSHERLPTRGRNPRSKSR